MTKGEALKRLEEYAAYLMDQIPYVDRREFASEASFKVMRLSKAEASKSGSYHLSPPLSEAETIPPPPEKKT